MEKKSVLDDDLKSIRDDLLATMVTLNREGKEGGNEAKTHISQVLAMLAGAIQEGQLASLSAEVYQWGKKSLANWKKINEPPTDAPLG